MLTYQAIIRRLTPIYDIGEARAITRLVLEERFNLSLTDIMLDGIEHLTVEQQTELEQIVCRLEQHEPVQYILGYQDFCGHRFHVEPGVLIPRPETENLVSPLLTSPRRGGIVNGVLDIGTGSGCIAISIALEHPDWQVEGWDISDTALHIAKGNAEALGAKNISFRKVDILNVPPLRGEDRWGLLISNPPYICRKEAASMERNVLDYEPDEALFVPDDDPLLFYRAITRFASTALCDGGHLLFEINRAYGREVCELMRSNGFSEVELLKDQFNNDRVVKGTVLHTKD